MRREAEVITAFLADRKIRARITGGFLAPAFAVYSLDVAAAQPFGRLEEALDDLQRVLYSARVRAGELDPNDPQQRVVVRASMQPPVLEVSRPKAARMELDGLPVDRLGPFEALAGVAFVTRRGQPILWRLNDPATPHALVAGTSGSGKSNLLLTLLLTLCSNTSPEQLSLFVVDGGNSSLMAARRLAHTVRWVGDAEGAVEVVHQVAALVQERKRRGEQGAAHRVLLVVDELANLLSVLAKGAAQQLQLELAIVAAEGRKFSVHLLAATQKPLAEVTGSLTKSNLAVRFVGAVTGWRDADTAMDMAGTGAERLAGRGDFLARMGNTVRRFQAPLVAGEIGMTRAINRRWAVVEEQAIHAALLQVIGGRTGALVGAVGAGQAQGEQTGARSTSAPVQGAGQPPAISLPLPRNRPPTPAEAAEIREMYRRMGSKNQVLQAVYGTKNTLLLSYVSEALAAS